MARWEILVSVDQVCAMEMETGYYTLSPDDPKLPEDVRKEMQEAIRKMQERLERMLTAMRRCKETLEKIVPEPYGEIEIEVVGSGGGISGVMGGGAYIPREEMEKYVRRYTKEPLREAEDLLKWGRPEEGELEEIITLKVEIAKLLARFFYPVRFVARKVKTSSGVVELEKPIQEVVYVPLPEYKKLKEVR